jgi:hypothetical protein
MATECDEVFSGDPEYGVTIQRFEDSLCLHHQGRYRETASKMLDDDHLRGLNHNDIHMYLQWTNITTIA